MASRIAYPEVRAALAAAERRRELSPDALGVAERDWQAYWEAIRPVELTAAVEQSAGQLARDHALRGADAVHLASALALEAPDLVLAAWDRRLRAGAAALGIRIAPADPVPVNEAPPPEDQEIEAADPPP